MLWAGAEARRDNISELWSWLCHHHELAVPEAAELFEDVEIAREPFEQDVPLEDYLARIRTTNNYLRMDAGTQQRLEQALTAVLREHGGVYPSRAFATLVTARRPPSRASPGPEEEQQQHPCEDDPCGDLERFEHDP